MTNVCYHYGNLTISYFFHPQLLSPLFLLTSFVPSPKYILGPLASAYTAIISTSHPFLLSNFLCIFEFTSI